MIIRKSSAELERMARAGRLVSETHQLLAEHIHAGVTTAELDRIAEEFIESRGGYPTFKGYRGYPAAICTSPNDMIVHGIPGPYRLSDGDILSVDIGVTLDGFIGDAAYTFAVGEISEEAPGCSRPARRRSPPASPSAGRAAGSPTCRTRCRR